MADDRGGQGRPSGRRQRYAGLLDHHKAPQIDRLFVISLRHRYAYCPVSKVANSSIKTFLYEAELLASGYAPDQFDFSGRRMHELLNSPLVRPFQLPRNLLLKVLEGDEFRRIVAVRHPVERVLSCFLDRVQETTSHPSGVVRTAMGREDIASVTFAEFVDFIGTQAIRDMDPHWRPIYHEAMFERVRYHDVLRFEDLASELPRLVEALYPRLAGTIDFARNLSPGITDARQRTDEFVTPSIRSRIETIYARDFETFGYE